MLIWEARLDDRYDCTVVRLEASLGRLMVKDSSNGHTLLDEKVPLSYEARFGPDVDDVTDWQDKCVMAVEVVDPSIVTLH